MIQHDTSDMMSLMIWSTRGEIYGVEMARLANGRFVVVTICFLSSSSS